MKDNFLKKAVDRAAKLNGLMLAEAGPGCFRDAPLTYEELCGVNMSAIHTKLIQDVGRFTEYHASDLLYTIPHIEEAVHNFESMDDIIYFGIRAWGVDHEEYIEANYKKEGANYLAERERYRKIYAVRVTKEKKDGLIDVYVRLYDISRTFCEGDVRDDIEEDARNGA